MGALIFKTIKDLSACSSWWDVLRLLAFQVRGPFGDNPQDPAWENPPGLTGGSPWGTSHGPYGVCPRGYPRVHRGVPKKDPPGGHPRVTTLGTPWGPLSTPPRICPRASPVEYHWVSPRESFGVSPRTPLGEGYRPWFQGRF